MNNREEVEAAVMLKKRQRKEERGRYGSGYDSNGCSH
jgi:hypothetical protein